MLRLVVRSSCLIRYLFRAGGRYVRAMTWQCLPLCYPPLKAQGQFHMIVSYDGVLMLEKSN